MKTSISLFLKKTTITSQQEVQDKCDGESFCRLQAKNSIFGDPCPGVAKYLTVTWKCNSLIGELYRVYTRNRPNWDFGCRSRILKPDIRPDPDSAGYPVGSYFLVHTTKLLICIK